MSFNKLQARQKTLLASATQTASAVSSTFNLAVDAALSMFLDVTASSSPTTLDVGVQFQAPNGSWYTGWKFAQVTTGTPPIGRWLSLNPFRAVSEAGVEFQEPITARATSSPTIAVVTTTAVVNNIVLPIGPNTLFRLVWAVAGTSYTFSVTLIEKPMNALSY